MIRRRMLTVAIIVAAALLPPGAGAQDGPVTGRIYIELPDGAVRPGQDLRVYLFREPLHPSAPEIPHGQIRYGVDDRVNSAHQNFFNRVQEKIAAGALVDTTLSDGNGRFRFLEPLSGPGFVVVTFPSKIAGYKVAWQVPVTPGPSGGLPMVLNQDNLALVTFSRDYAAVFRAAGPLRP